MRVRNDLGRESPIRQFSDTHLCLCCHSDYITAEVLTISLEIIFVKGHFKPI